MHLMAAMVTHSSSATPNFDPFVSHRFGQRGPIAGFCQTHECLSVDTEQHTIMAPGRTGLLALRGTTAVTALLGLHKALIVPTRQDTTGQF